MHKFVNIFIIALFFCMGCASQVEKRKEILLKDSIQGFLGTPYQWGSVSEKGIDCSGFTQEIYRKAGVVIPRTVEGQFKSGRKVENDELEYGDLVFFYSKQGDTFDCCLSPCLLPNLNIFRSKTATHVGIYVGEEKFVHASISRGVITDNLNIPYWKERFLGARRLLK